MLDAALGIELEPKVLESTLFSAYGLPDQITKALVKMGFETPTLVQQKSIPLVMEGKDVLALAPTGTGKTGAFGIPMMAKLLQSDCHSLLVLAPTRELAQQIMKVLEKVAEFTDLRGALVVGGESFGRQIKEVKSCDYIVATPGRLIDHLEARTFSLKAVRALVLDEFDRMLDMGFAPQMEAILEKLPEERQTMLFSATLPKEVMALAQSFVKDPVKVIVGSPSQKVEKIKETEIETTMGGRDTILFEQLNNYPGRVLIFTRTRTRSERLVRVLGEKDVKAGMLHGGLTQGQRKLALNGFRRGDCRILVATDIAARGIDVNDIELVVNYDMPQTEEDYVHRVGRTGRIGKEGTALNFIVTNDDNARGRVYRGKSAGSKGGKSGGGFRGGRRDGQGGGSWGKKSSSGGSWGRKPSFGAEGGESRARSSNESWSRGSGDGSRAPRSNDHGRDNWNRKPAAAEGGASGHWEKRREGRGESRDGQGVRTHSDRPFRGGKKFGGAPRDRSNSPFPRTPSKRSLIQGTKPAAHAGSGGRSKPGARAYSEF